LGLRIPSLGIGYRSLRISGWLRTQLPQLPHLAECAAAVRVLVVRIMTSSFCLGVAVAWLPDQP
jgi:hypothetical protein